MIEIRVRGERRPPEQLPNDLDALYRETEPGDEFSYEVAESIVPGSGRAATRATTLQASDHDIIEVEDADGVVTFHTAASIDDEDLERGLRNTPTRSGSDPLVRVTRAKLTLPPRIVDDVNIVDAAIGDTGLDFVRDRVFDAAARQAMVRIARWVEKPLSDEEYAAPANEARRRKRPKTHGLYRLGPDLLVEPDHRITPERPLAEHDDPYLLLLHGTFSHTEAAFGAMRGREDWNQLAGRYGDRLLALEHPTLSATPVENALAAVRSLPRGSRLHLLSHSRGGLIGDLLGLTSYEEPDIAALQDPAEAATLEALRREMVDREVAVTRFVRVACPGSGTTLASRRLDLYATAVFNVLNLVPGLGQSGVAEMVKRFALTLLDKRSDARLLPGIEAMMPESSFIRLLATSPPIDDGLGAVAGDIEGKGILDRLKVIATNLFYLEDHDLVVNTSAMDRGVRRKGGRRAFFKGPGVSHSAYFSDDASRAAICTWLASTDADLPPFAPIEPPTRAAARRDAGVTELPPVVVVPDVFGSSLLDGDTVVWPDVPSLARATVAGAFDPASARVPGELVQAYEPLLDHLGSVFDVRPFAYDWRRSFEETGKELADAIDAVHQESTGARRPVHAVTHGAGALVLAAALRHRPDLLDGSGASSGRVVMLSPPLDGSARPAALVEGAGELPAQLRLVDPTTGPDELAKLFGGYPSLQELSGPTSTDGMLGGAVAVYGAAASTIVATDEGLRAGAAGDGNVAFPVRSRPGITTLYGRIPSAEMPGDSSLAGDVVRLLSSQPARQLTELPATSSRELTPLDDVDGRLQFPGESELIASAMGGRTRRAVGAATDSLRVSVTHGNLVHTDLPLLVGVYEGTPIRGAEGALDKRMGGILATRVALGRFPGPVGTTDVVGSPLEGAPLAVVIGMGHNGDLTAARLTSGVHQALLGLAVHRLEQGVPDPITVAAVLVGTSGAVSLPVATSLAAIVTGTLRANRRLREAGHPMVIDHLEVIELYEDRAIEAVNAARGLSSEIHLVSDERLVVNEILQVGTGGLPGLPPPDYHRDRWRTIRVGVQAPEQSSPDPHRRFTDSLGVEFTAIGLGSGAEQRVSVSQRRLVDALIAQSIENPAVDRQTYNTLYELLVPDGLKGQAKETENLLYVLDEPASTIPFEMLSPRLDDSDVEPFAVDVGILRQLETSSFRENVRPAAGHRALVIGDPPTTRFERLPGAILEARKVQAVLEQHGYAVESLIPADASDTDSVDFVSIMNALFRYDYRIIHIAAHGNYDPDRPDQSGIVIGDDQFLTALEIRQMQTTPDLVFLNACHVGSMVPRSSLGDGAPEALAAWRPDRLAASISRQLIDNGVRAVVAAGWAVADDAAAEFAEHFYDRLLTGLDLGEAVRIARRRIYRAHRHVNTWGAYQVYGQPAFRLDRVMPSSRPHPPIVSRKQLTEKLKRLLGDASGAESSERVADVHRELMAVIGGAAESWMGGEQRALAGRVAFELGDYEMAVDQLGRAVEDWGAEAPLRAVEQLINARVKLAIQRRDDSSADLLTLARNQLDHLTGLGITPERSGIHGSFWRRQVLLTKSNGAIVSKQTAVRNALDAYQRGWDTSRLRARDDYYLGPNLVLLMWASGSSEQEATTDILQRSLAAADADRGFWARVTPADIALVEAIVTESLESRTSEVANAYRAALAEGSSRMQRRTIAEHLEIVEATLPRTAPTADSRAALAQLRDDLAADLA